MKQKLQIIYLKQIILGCLINTNVLDDIFYVLCLCLSMTLVPLTVL